MLPILRILPVGGVFFAILILVLALKAPGERLLPPPTFFARSSRADSHEDPQWRQVAIQAALRRATELMRLRDLPDTPMRSEPAPPIASESSPPSVSQEPAAAVETPAPMVAGLPTDRVDADPDPDSITGAIEESPGATIPVEIGAASSFELPVVLPEERPAIIRLPERKPPHESRRKRAPRSARPKETKPQPQKPAQPVGLLEELLSKQRSQSSPAGSRVILNQTRAYRANAGYSRPVAADQ